MNPLMVVPDMSPMAHRISSTTAMVHSMLLTFLSQSMGRNERRHSRCELFWGGLRHALF
jgi:hypothetical protein